MKQSQRAALFSAAIFPGSGHIVLRRYLPGIAFGGIAIACLAVLVDLAMTIARNVSNRILSGEIAPDMGVILDEVSAQSASTGWTPANIATWVLILCWIVATIDAYRLGKRADRAAEAGAAG